jgi:hypothetical protein
MKQLFLVLSCLITSIILAHIDKNSNKKLTNENLKKNY